MRRVATVQGMSWWVVWGAVLLLQGSAKAAWIETSWIADPGTPARWVEADNWSDGVPDSDAYIAHIDNGGAALITEGDTTPEANQIYLGLTMEIQAR